MSYGRIPTSAEVFAVIRARHPELRVFGSYTATDGSDYDPSRAKMSTSYCFEQYDYPVIEIQTTWDIPSDGYDRKNERHEYWLCFRGEE